MQKGAGSPQEKWDCKALGDCPSLPSKCGGINAPVKQGSNVRLDYSLRKSLTEE